MKKRYLAYLGYLLLLTLALTAVSLSRFRTTVNSNAQVSVARPVLNYVPVSLNGAPVSPSGNELSLSDLKPGDVLVYKFDINNFNGDFQNQVKLKYKISVSFVPAPPILPLSYTLEPDVSYAPDGNGYTYLGFGSDITHSYTLTVTWPASETGDYANKAQTIQIQVNSEQVDN